MKFGDDWTGLFIRGDEAFGMAQDITLLVEWYNKLPKELKNFNVYMAINNLLNYGNMIRNEVVEK